MRILDKIDAELDGYATWTGDTEDAADSSAADLDDQAEDDPTSEFALVDNGWLIGRSPGTPGSPTGGLSAT